MRLSDFDFDVQYKKGYANTQADAFSRLATLGETTLDANNDILCFVADAMDEALESEEREDDWDIISELLIVARAATKDGLEVPNNHRGIVAGATN